MILFEVLSYFSYGYFYFVIAVLFYFTLPLFANYCNLHFTVIHCDFQGPLHFFTVALLDVYEFSSFHYVSKEPVYSL